MNDGRTGISQRAFQIVALVLSVTGLVTAVSYIFHLNLVPIQIDLSYLYIILTIYGSAAFLFFRVRKKNSPSAVPWYDWILFLFVLASGIYLASHGLDIIAKGWSLAAPLQVVIIALILWAVIIEGVRRSSGIPLTVIALFFSLYPLLAPRLPGLLWGPPAFSLTEIAVYHFLSNASVMGLPMQVVGTLVFGYIVFGVTLHHTGGGKFFLDFALSLLGHVRGGVAKVAIVSSALFGTMSGAVASNVIITGSVTIPAMKRTGYPSHIAGAIETCSSTGGALMPPVMGAVAFVMAMTLGVSYYIVAAAAVIPSVLYFLSLFIQADAYAARQGIKGLDREELPDVKRTLMLGWPYLFSLVLLTFFLFYLRREAQAPFYASAFLIAYAMVRKETRFTLRSFAKYLTETTRFLADLTMILAGVGFIIGSFYITGLGGTFSYEITRLAGGNLALLLIFGAASSFVLGMGMTATAVYIFLAITVAPGLVAAGVNPIAAHMFILYWGILSYITPPVAIGAYAAAPIAGAPPMKVGFAATRLGMILYILPFFFVLNPSLVLQGDPVHIIVNFISAVLGVILIGGGMERYGLGMGVLSIPLAVPALIAGLLLFYPHLQVSLAGLALAAVVFIIARVTRARRAKPLPS